MKFLGFLLVILGFSYSMTSFYNFYSYLFGNVIIASANVVIMAFGLLVPLYMLIFGLYFYFYADTNITKINNYIFISSLSLLITGIVIIVLKNDIIYRNFFFIAQITEYLHVSFGYILTFLGIMIVYGCVKYKY